MTNFRTRWYVDHVTVTLAAISFCFLADLTSPQHSNEQQLVLADPAAGNLYSYNLASQQKTVWVAVEGDGMWAG